MPQDVEHYDYIVIGAGSAGAVVAARLSEDANKTVLLLEAGPEDKLRWIHIPAGMSRTISNPDVNWLYFSEEEPGLNGRKMFHPRGKVLGGSSAINGMAYVRGHARDYDQWAQMGNKGWSYEEVLPLFKKSETFHAFSSGQHGTGGEVGVDHGVLKHPASRKFMDAAIQNGIPEVEDYNDGNLEGASWLQFNIAGGVRQSTGRAFLKPIRGRANLNIQTEALVHRINVEEGRAVSVTYEQGGQTKTAAVRGEVILSGGAFNSPHILNLSGIGAGDELADHGIATVHELPGVGKNLQDHLYTTFMAKTTPENSINQRIQGARLIPEVLRYMITKRGFLATGASNTTVFTKILPGAATSDVQMMFRPMSFSVIGGDIKVHAFPGFSTAICPLRPDSIGRVWLNSADPREKPRIWFNYLDAESDRQAMVGGFRKVLDILSEPAMRDLVVETLMPESPYDMTDEDILEFARETAQTVYHPVGTCKMGSDAMSVVDDRLRVHGVRGLRVADASIMPRLVSGNTNAPSMMIGEKCAEMVKQDAA